jgi:hypothetical protein
LSIIREFNILNMGGVCSSGNTKETSESKNSLLTEKEIAIIKNSWKLVTNGGLSKYGTNMMIK